MRYPLDTLTNTLEEALWARAVTIADAGDFNTYNVYQQLQRDTVALIIDNLGVLGESPAMKREREECALKRPSPCIEDCKDD
jgi:hypothetical protein